MKPFELLSQAQAPDGTALKLVRRDDEYLILAGDKPLMSSRMHGSEEALAEAACRKARTLKHPQVLIGGLGMGFTLRAALRILPTQSTVVVVELVPAVVDWNRGPLGALSAYPLNDNRVRVEMNDVAAAMRLCPGQFDAILLDVDNGPAAFTVSNNAALYNDAGIKNAYKALNRNGVLALWSAREDRDFELRLRNAGLSVKVERVSARGKSGGARHTIYLGYKSAASGTPEARSQSFER